MIAKKIRIPRKSIAYILKKGEGLSSNLFIIKYIKGQEQFSRFRVIVSKKIEKKAVKRNKLRRQIYEAIRINSNLQENPNKTFDIILIPKKQILKCNFTDINEDIKKAINNG